MASRFDSLDSFFRHRADGKEMRRLRDIARLRDNLKVTALYASKYVNSTSERKITMKSEAEAKSFFIEREDKAPLRIERRQQEIEISKEQKGLLQELQAAYSAYSTEELDKEDYEQLMLMLKNQADLASKHEAQVGGTAIQPYKALARKCKSLREAVMGRNEATANKRLDVEAPPNTAAASPSEAPQTRRTKLELAHTAVTKYTGSALSLYKSAKWGDQTAKASVLQEIMPWELLEPTPTKAELDRLEENITARECRFVIEANHSCCASLKSLLLLCRPAMSLLAAAAAGCCCFGAES